MVPVVAGNAECPICKGAGWLRLDLPVGHPAFGKPVMCECLMATEEARRASELEELSALSQFHVDMSFDNFDSRIPGTREAFEEAWKFSRNPDGWLVIVGGCGSGKTHLAVAIIREARRNHLSLFVVVPDLLDHLRSTFSPDSPVRYDRLFDLVRNTGLLVLDDLGTESSTPWAQEKLYQIINYRYNNRYPTVITTNRRIDSIEERIQSRICDRSFCKIVEITAGDYRDLNIGQRQAGTAARPRPPLGRRQVGR